jgi:hypothetical protein
VSEPKQVASVRLSPELRATIDERARVGEGASTIIARAVERYFEVCRLSLPRFTTLQWTVIAAALENAALHDSHDLMSIENRIATYMLERAPDRKRLLPDILQKFEGMTIAERVSLVDHVERHQAQREIAVAR